LANSAADLLLHFLSLDLQHRGDAHLTVKLLSIGVFIDSLVRQNPALCKAAFCTESLNPPQAFSMLQKKRYSCVVIGPAVPEKARNQLASIAKISNPKAVVIMLYNGSIRHAELADAVLNAATVEHHLAETIVHLLRLDQPRAFVKEKQLTR